MSRDGETPGTCVALLTPQGRGAVSVLRLWGRDAIAIASAAFRPQRGASLAASAPGRLRLGRIGHGLGDEVVAVVASVDPPRAEIHCHGGPAAVSLVLDTLTALGAQIQSPERAIAESARTALAAQAEIDLARATTLRTAEVLLDQSQGALDAELCDLDRLIDSDFAAASARLETLLERARWGCRLADGWRVVLAGRPNVGKSRLLNALAGYERAIVDPTPGTTRDVVSVRTACDGWPVELSDTTGLRATTDHIEAAGVAQARTVQAQADLVVLVLDRAEPLSPADEALMHEHASAPWVANKADLPAAWDGPRGDVAVVSAETGQGIDALSIRIARRLAPAALPPGAGVPFRSAHVRLLEEVREALRAANRQRAHERLEALSGWASERVRLGLHTAFAQAPPL